MLTALSAAGDVTNSHTICWWCNDVMVI